jgi:hypothetical protein
MVHSKDQIIYLIGGATDCKIKNTLKTVQMFDFGTTGEVKPVTKASMNSARASFGCTLSHDKSTIYVSGGYATENTSFEKCEMYKIAEDKWTELPSMNDTKCSNSLCEFKAGGKTWLYSFCGIKRSPNLTAITLLDDIERLDLGNLAAGWEKLAFKVPEKVNDVGVVQISDKMMMIFGGCSIKSMDNVAFFEPGASENNMKSATNASEKLEKADFFPSNGAATVVNNKLEICGNTYIHIFDLATKQFKAIASS